MLSLLRKTSYALSSVFALGLATSAHAQYISSIQPIGSGGGLSLAASSPLYSGIPGPYTAFAAATGVLSFDDYQTVATTPTFLPDTLRFVGGVSAANQRINFDFFRPDTSRVTGFSVTFGGAGAFIYTISGLSGLGYLPSAGFLQLTAPAGSLGQWFFTSTAPTIGSNSVTVGTGSGLNPQRNNAFELNGVTVPEPGSVALMLGMTTLGGMLTLRRRRK